MVRELSNKNPVVYERKERLIRHSVVPADVDEYAIDPIDQQEIFDHIRDIKDPEYPYTLEQLRVVTEDSVEIDDKNSHVRVTYTPTIGQCSLAPAIGLCLQVKLVRSLPSRYKVDIKLAPGTHDDEAAINKQMNDKERTTAALENPVMGQLVGQCLAPTYE